MRGATILFAIVWPHAAAAETARPSIWIIDTIAREAERAATFKLVLSHQPTEDVRIEWTAEALTASAADLAAASGELTIPGQNPPLSSGAVSLSFEVPIVADEEDEGSEAFLVRLEATDAAIADGLAHGVIRDRQLGSARCDLVDDGHSDVLARRPTGPEPGPHRANHDTWMPISTIVVTVQTSGETHWTLETAADFDGDGACDYLWSPEEGSKEPLAITGNDAIPEDANKGVPVRYLERPPDGWRIVGAADLTGDGVAEVLWWDAAEPGLHAWTCLSACPSPRPVTLEGCTDIAWEPAAIGRISRDEMPDVLGYTGKDLIYRPLKRSGGAPACGEPGTVPEATGTELAAVGDFDADGTEDLLLENRPGGSGPLAGPRVLFMADRAARAWSGLQLGGADIIWRDYLPGRIAGPR